MADFEHISIKYMNENLESDEGNRSNNEIHDMSVGGASQLKSQHHKKGVFRNPSIMSSISIPKSIGWKLTTPPKKGHQINFSINLQSTMKADMINDSTWLKTGHFGQDDMMNPQSRRQITFRQKLNGINDSISSLGHNQEEHQDPEEDDDENVNLDIHLEDSQQEGRIMKNV